MTTDEPRLGLESKGGCPHNRCSANARFRVSSQERFLAAAHLKHLAKKTAPSLTHIIRIWHIGIFKISAIPNKIDLLFKVFLDAIAAPSTYPRACQSVSGSVGQSVIDSFKLEITIASPSFASLLVPTGASEILDVGDVFEITPNPRQHCRLSICSNFGWV